MDTRVSARTRLSLLPVFVALLLNLVVGPLGALVGSGPEPVAAATTIEDQQGANDEPGQKDLTQLTIDYAGAPATVNVIFNLDDTVWTGANTGDGCSLFDTDGDGNVNFALCATVAADGTTAQIQTISLYTCDQDAKPDRCTGPALVSPTGSTCTAVIDDNDPFSAADPNGPGDFFPDDTVVDCTIPLSEVGALSAVLVNVCSYPSREPNSDPSDCVLIVDSGKLEVKKALSPTTDPGLFDLLINGNILADNVGHNGSTGEQTVSVNANTVGEAAGTGTSLANYTSSISCIDTANANAAVTATQGTGLSWTVNVTSGSDIVCTISNARQTGKLEVKKALSPTTDPGLFDLLINNVVEADNVGHNGSTGEETLNTGTHTVGEAAGTGTSLANYASTIECRSANGTGAVVASGSGAGPLNVSVTNGSDIVCVITNTRVTVGFDKANDEGDNAAIEPGETIHFTLTVTVNNGPATGIVITDQLPTGLGNDTNITDGGTYSAATNRITWNVGDLAQGIHTFEYDATVAANASGTLTNLGCVDADQNDQLVCDQTSLRVQNIVIDKTNATTGPVLPGTAVDFTLALDVTNGPIDNVTIVDQLPAGIGNVTLISDGGTYNPTTNRITWNLTNVADNETLTYRAVVSATATARTLTNIATITDGPCVGGTCDDESTVIVRVPTLVADKVASTETITISGPNDALVATPSIVTWTITYTVTNGPVTGAVITDQVPTGFTFLDAAIGGTFANGTITWNLGTLTTSGSVTFRTTVNPATISRTGPTVNTAVIDSNETAPDSGQDSVTVTVTPPVLAGNPTPTPAPLPNTATGFGLDGTPISVPIELMVAFFIGSLGALTLASARTRGRRR